MIVILFTYAERGKVMNIAYPSPGKNEYQAAGGSYCFVHQSERNCSDLKTI